MQPLRIGVVGCGNISNQYFKVSNKLAAIEIVACADLDLARAQAKAQEHGIAKACSVDELIRDDEVDLVLNLTIPAAHAEIALRAIEAGKHTYAEKPFALTVEEGRSILAAAKAKGVRVGCAPDTFLGTSHQACRRLIESGRIGTPVAATALMLCPGHESWHPAPEFYYQPGGGPMLDMGPYYLTALINLLGPIDRVSGEATIAINPRTITSEPMKGTTIDVQTPDHVAGTVRFASGCIGTIVTSFACRRDETYERKNPIIIYGTKGTLKVPDPNGFNGPVFIADVSAEGFVPVDVDDSYPNGRSLGVADLAYALRDDRPHLASGELAQSVLEAMLGFLESSQTGRHITIAPATQPAPLPADLIEAAEPANA